MKLFQLPIKLTLVLIWFLIAANPVRSQSGNMSDITMPNPGEVNSETPNDTNTDAEEPVAGDDTATDTNTDAEEPVAGDDTATDTNTDAEEPVAGDDTATDTNTDAEEPVAGDDTDITTDDTPMEEAIVDEAEIPTEDNVTEDNTDTSNEEAVSDDDDVEDPNQNRTTNNNSNNDSDAAQRNADNENVMEAIANNADSEPEVVTSEDNFGATLGENTAGDSNTNVEDNAASEVGGETTETDSQVQSDAIAAPETNVNSDPDPSFQSVTEDSVEQNVDTTNEPDSAQTITENAAETDTLGTDAAANNDVEATGDAASNGDVSETDTLGTDSAANNDVEATGDAASTGDVSETDTLGTDTTANDDVEATGDAVSSGDVSEIDALGTDTAVSNDVEATGDAVSSGDVSETDALGTDDTAVSNDVEATGDAASTDDVSETDTLGTDTAANDDVEATGDAASTDDVSETDALGTDTAANDDVEATEDIASTDDVSETDAVATENETVERTTEELEEKSVAAAEETEEETVAEEPVEEDETAEIEEAEEETVEEEAEEEIADEEAEETENSQDLGQEIDRVAYEVQVQESPTDMAIQMQEEYQLTQLMGTSGLQLYGQIPSVKEISSRLAELGEQTGKNPAFINISLQSNQLEAFVVLPNDVKSAQKENSLVASTDLNKIDSSSTPKALTLRETVKDTSRKELIATATQFREEVSDSSKLNQSSYMKSSRELYKLLIEPIEAELKANNIDILVFSMDSGLRLLPLAALHDGEQFLIEKYAVATVPSFGLTDTRYVSLDQSSILAMGASEFSEQAALPTMPIELEAIVSEPRQGEVFINEQFTIENFKAQNQRENPFPIVHLGTHAEFKAGSLNDSYIQFYDDRLKIPQLQDLSNELGWNSDATPIELLVLSACETALGDEEAELGFAGLAVQAGVKSALASLWYVSDVGTLALMGEFYDRLDDTLIKAEALRQTQLKMLQGNVKVNNKQVELSNGQNLGLPPEFPEGTLTLDHPYFWSSFTLIGNWN